MIDGSAPGLDVIPVAGVEKLLTTRVENISGETRRRLEALGYIVD